jgi:hypothetical protein
LGTETDALARTGGVSLVLGRCGGCDQGESGLVWTPEPEVGAAVGCSAVGSGAPLADGSILGHA